MTLLLAAGAAGCSSSKGRDIAVVELPPAAPADDVALSSEEPDASAPARRTGWVTEADGSVHRATASRCDATNDQPSCRGNEKMQLCKSDADCKEGPHGKCVTAVGQIGTYCGCEYSCESDVDCGASSACVCKGTGALRETHSVCAQARCTTDDDCLASTCGLSAYHNGCGEQVMLACRTAEDTCRSDADCGRQGDTGLACVVIDAEGADARWQCMGRTCVIGRPLVVEGAPRAAPAAARDDWQAPAPLDAAPLASLAPDLRALAAAHYAAMAALEHASIASFARFSLQLLALGAPADLVAEAHRSALDEMEHARLAYGIASRLAGRSIGPGPLLEAASAPLGAGVAEVVEALVEEGCVGEALGAAEGRELARRAGDPALAAALARIADDEERHAAFAWRALAWLLATFGEPARAAADRAFSRAAARFAIDPAPAPAARFAIDPAPAPAAHEALGLLPTPAIGALRREVLAEVVAPCRAALLDPPRAPERPGAPPTLQGRPS
ncbi:ferritin-like domain-containing protein [Sorangium sp. So ce131]|uniref:ferritin-like domain-containing protein n=1 Tax=Sorangium sp. So ce131 TaxID=3133282 RepID=UPI003F646000